MGWAGNRVITFNIPAIVERYQELTTIAAAPRDRGTKLQRHRQLHGQLLHEIL
jgi:hypothetical protein